jgi:uncharacterized protein YecE (DUF72 family)
VTARLGGIRVGTSSWTEKTLVENGTFYPASARSAEARLRHYAQHFDVVEVDATYYALPSARNAAAWVERTPPAFRFGVKAFAAMTGHPVEPARLDRDLQAALPAAMRRARQVAAAVVPSEIHDEIWRRFRVNLEPLVVAKKLAYVLLQFPPWLAASIESRRTIENAAGRLAGLTVAVEFREAGWLAPDAADATLAWLRDRGLVYVAVDEPQGTRASVPPIAEATSDRLSVVRFHGRNRAQWTRPGASTTERFGYLYRREELAEWVPRLHALARASRTVVALMNNCYRDYATRNAVDLAGLLRESGEG